MRTEHIRVRLFIEGVLMPDVGQVTVQTFANEVSRASFTIPPVPGFETEELKRARVHIFWSDIGIRSDENRAEDDWPLLFEGEIVADSYSKGVTHRNQVFQCAGYHTYWEQVMLYYYDTSHPMPAQAPWAQGLAVALGNKQLQLDGQVAGANLHQRILAVIEDNADKSYHSIVQKVFSESMDVNFFYQQQNAALALDQRFVTPKDPNIELLIGRQRFKEGLDLDVLSVGGQQTMMELLKSVLKLFRYNICCNAQPVLLDERARTRRTASRIERDTEKIEIELTQYLEKLQNGDNRLEGLDIERIAGEIDGQTPPDDITDLASEIVDKLKYDDAVVIEGQESLRTRALNTIKEELTATNFSLGVASNPTATGDEPLETDFENLLAQYLLLPDMRFALPPTCNVIFPQDQTGFTLDRQLMHEPTRAISVPTDSPEGRPFPLLVAPPEIQRAVIPATPVAPSTAAGFHPVILAPHRVSSPYGWRQIRQRVPKEGGGTKVLHPDGKKFHHGIDLARPRGTSATDFEGKADIHAFESGVVTRAGWQSYNKKGQPLKKTGYGLRVTIKHENGIESRYGHMHSIAPGVTRGERVERGQVIGKVGNTGSSTGAHLHFEVRVNGRPTDPGPLLENAREAPSESQAAPETDGATTSSTNAKPILEAGDGEDSDFKDWEFLTEEEQFSGIIPYFDLNTARAHSFLAFQGQGFDADSYLLQQLNSEFLWRRYQTRSLSGLTMPFNPNPIAGFPGLVVDRVRSIIGLVTSVTHTLSVGGGQGNATTTVQLESPRYWDEGDPYHWIDGEVKTSTVDGKKIPDPNKAVMPSYYLQALVGTNSTDEDKWWEAEDQGAWKLKERPVDTLYNRLLGGAVYGIPFQFASRETTRGTTVVYNKAIDSRDAATEQGRIVEKPNLNTIVGRYYKLADASKGGRGAEEWVRSFTRRRGATEREIMTVVLGATTDNGGISYGGTAAFRAKYQEAVQKMVKLLSLRRQFRG